MNNYQGKPYLVILEGPAGVGKTTMQNYLYKTLSVDNDSVGVLPEFSKNKIDEFIEMSSHYEKITPKCLTGILQPLSPTDS